MGRRDFLVKSFLEAFALEPTGCQRNLFEALSDFAVGDDADILVVNGYAGTGKTSAMSAAVKAFKSMGIQSVLMAPTGRAAKVLSSFAGMQAHTIHKSIYRQKSVGSGGTGNFSLAPNKRKNTLFVVDEASLIGIDAQAPQAGGALFGSGNLLEDLVAFVRNGCDCRLVLMGDSAQLPPVGLDESPALSKEYMDQFGGVRYCTLSDVVRQAADSGIVANATNLRNLLIDNQYGQSFRISLRTAGYPEMERVAGSDLLEVLSDAYGRYGEDETIVLCRSNKRAIRYNLGIRSMIQFREERLVRGEKLMIVKNCYQFLDDVEDMDYIANGDIAVLRSIKGYEERYGLHFANAVLSFPDYGDVEIKAKVCLDTLESESASLTAGQQNALYEGVDADYADIKSKSKRYSAVREDKYYNALQLKYASAITCHKSQGGQWKCVFIDCPFWQDIQTSDDVKWLYTALTRAVEKVYFVNFNDRFFK